MPARRVAPLLLCVLWGPSSASALAQEQEVEMAEATCTAWSLDIANHIGFPLDIYQYLGEKLIHPSVIRSHNLTWRLAGDHIQTIPPRDRKSSLLFGARPAVIVFSVKSGEWVLRGLASPQQQRANAGSALSQKMTLKFTCASN